ncbi:MAG: YibE/F family protein, partial [Parcubacteria group bacterium CG_4_10_14_0_8_um_filter_35_7]
LFASIIIGALGAVMDIGMSISSSVTEVKKTYPYARMQELIKSGLTVGRDVMGTMVNTLIFAYVGVSLPLLLLFTKYGGSYLKFLNFEFVAEEVVRSIAGSIGLVAAIPLTAIIAGYLEGAKRETKNKK